MTEAVALLKRLIDECEPWLLTSADFMQCYFCGKWDGIDKRGAQRHEGDCIFTAAQRLVEKANLLEQESFVVREDGKLYRRIPPGYNPTGA